MRLEMASFRVTRATFGETTALRNGVLTLDRAAVAAMALGDSNLTGVAVERTTQKEFGAPYRKPVFSALSLEKARRLGIEMPPWRDALERYLRGGD